MKKIYQEVYPFTTEMISSYFEDIDFKDKEVLTVGSSLDQAYNALLLGAKNITVYDINENIIKFGKIKRDLILSTPRTKLIDEVLKVEDVPLSKDAIPRQKIIEANLYLQNDKNYERLREILSKYPNRIKYVIGDLMKVNNIDGELFDIIITSNVFQNIGCFIKDEDPYLKLKEVFELLKLHLTEEGLIQLLYHYNIEESHLKDTCDDPIATRNIKKVYDSLQTRNLFLSTFKGVQEKDAIMTYQKKKV